MYIKNIVIITKIFDSPRYWINLMSTQLLTIPILIFSKIACLFDIAWLNISNILSRARFRRTKFDPRNIVETRFRNSPLHLNPRGFQYPRFHYSSPLKHGLKLLPEWRSAGKANPASWSRNVTQCKYICAK